MSLTVSTDLSVTTSPSQLEVKLEDGRNAKKESMVKGEPKIFGVSQIVLGFVIITYSIPLLEAEFTLILNLGVPWWTGLVFVISGAVAIAVEKHTRISTLNACLAVSGVAITVSFTALILYLIDILYNPTTECKIGPHNECDNQFYVTHFSTGVKETIFFIIMVQAATSSAFTAILYKQRNNFTGYVNVNE